MKYFFIILVIIIVILGFIFLNSDSDSETSSQTGNRVGDSAPHFTVIDYDGNEVSLSDFEGRSVFINFWATWCPFCVDELPLMAQVQQEFGDQYVTIAINRAESRSLAQGYTDDLGISDDMIFVLDDDDDLYKRVYGAAGMPYSLFIDSDGVIQSIVRGPLTESSLKDNVNKIIK